MNRLKPWTPNACLPQHATRPIAELMSTNRFRTARNAFRCPRLSVFPPIFRPNPALLVHHMGSWPVGRSSGHKGVRVSPACWMDCYATSKSAAN